MLQDLIPEAQGPQITTATIMGQTASYFGLSIEDLCSTSQSRVLVTARHIAMYLCRELTDLSLPKIGQKSPPSRAELSAVTANSGTSRPSSWCVFSGA